MVINREGEVADVYLVRGAESQARLIQGALGTHGRIQWVDRPYAALLATRDQVTSAIEWIRSIGLVPISWGPEPARNGVVLSVRRSTPDQERRVHDRFGQFVSVVETEDDPRLAGGRWADSQPWLGGDTLLSPGICTAGPAIRNPQSGNVYFLVAAHCGAVGVGWYNGVPYTSVPNSRYVGDTAYRDGSWGGTDSAIVYSNAGPFDWRYGTNSAPQKAAIATIDQEQGVCASGSLSGEICSTTIVAVDLCAFFDSGTIMTCNIAVTQRDGIAVAGYGDSGSPVYSVRPDGGLDIRGILVGADARPPHVVTCLYWVRPGRTCSDKVYYVTIQAVLAVWAPGQLYTYP